MLEKMDLTKKMDKETYKERLEELQAQLGELQRECKTLEIPVMIAFEGFDAAGKGSQIAELIQALDPRGFEVHAVKQETENERMYPFLWRFWTKTPENGRIAIYDSSWYRRVLIERFEKLITNEQLGDAYDSICAFERQLSDGGMAIIKIFLCVDQKEQRKRFDKLLESKDTAWRVTKGDLERNEKFAKYLAINEEMLQKTDTDYAPWTLVEATDRRFATIKIYTTVIQILRAKVEAAKRPKPEVPQSTVKQEYDKELQSSILSKADLSKSLTEEEYKKNLKVLQKKIKKLHGEMYLKRIPLVLGFEGWDAGGKGGAIKRLTQKMDPRGYVVHPTASPNDIERKHHYLWRFWEAMPKNGHATIFDRTWYGRVMVERIEGFCTKEEWQRAYKEINDMENDLVNAGAVVIKFWLQIDKDEQERRFEERKMNPEKQWKITDEDWRNREKWDQYEEAVDEMLIRTSTPKSPWVVVEGNDKYYARIKVLQTVVDALEAKLKES
ncbi:polyphosphate:AMP phosphotransferase [Hespellia stercorisuis]|uniref:Polyphosphate:AMP phosphotransferase n=1 Tax=Hespellia stercorisuis DSM 15480 TaxID=1121950 RepID=A0A1M6VY42_9FIRM|nr:polyphosphate:AMP phosphotransferase [Hespellia stercorisuis]SHK86390.1 Polyphosphate:AMP phosphotransferase [Hespellia stercorisuis DSM 15480]